MGSSRLAMRFIEAINLHHVEAVLDLMTDDHLFVDSSGHVLKGRDRLQSAWQTYFEMVPDYRIEAAWIFEREAEVALFGLATGTCAVAGVLLPENHWQIPAAWRAVVRDDRIAHWQVYADNEPVRRILAGITAPDPE